MSHPARLDGDRGLAVANVSYPEVISHAGAVGVEAGWDGEVRRGASCAQ